MRWQALLLAALALTTGCIGMGGDDADTDDDIDAQSDEEPLGQTNETETNETTTTMDWSTETFEGSITGTSFFAPAPPSQGQNFTFEVANGTEELFINVTTEGGELTMNVANPECQPNGGCEEEVQTEDGEGQYAAQQPLAGEWNVRFFPSDTVANGVSYTADVAQGVLVEA